MKTARIVILILFFVLSAIHLKDSYNDDQNRRKKTKPFLVLSLLLYYLLLDGKTDLLLAASLVLCWLGDVLLIPHGNKWFIAGGIAFLLGHVCFIALYSRSIVFASIPWLLAAIAALIYFGTAFAVIRLIRKTTPKAMVVPMYLYLLCNSTMNLFALIRLYQMRSAGALIAFIGAILFFASDCVLFIVRYYSNKDAIYKKHFTVMLTYLAGVLLILMGMIRG
ncbi:MAG: lysoplasmalogenase [Erysipelotrichaceae bacterium]|nr:lysoplasmalogenase [Erysipelotrichaceae bacterium]